MTKTTLVNTPEKPQADAYAHKGGCDCGAVIFEYHTSASLPEQTARTCQCEFCRPRKATYLSDIQAELHVFVKNLRYLYAHRFGTNTADFMCCAVCNATVFVKMNWHQQEYGAVYARALNEFDSLVQFQSMNYDGESLAERLQRRADNWIPTVAIHFGDWLSPSNQRDTPL